MASLYPPRFGGTDFFFRPTSKRHGVWARTVKRSLVPTIKKCECRLEGEAQAAFVQLCKGEKIT